MSAGWGGVEDDRWAERGEFDRQQDGCKMTAGWGGVEDDHQYGWRMTDRRSAWGEFNRQEDGCKMNTGWGGMRMTAGRRGKSLPASRKGGR